MNFLIIGASTGIGAALLDLLKDQHQVYCISRNRPSVESPSIYWQEGDVTGEVDLTFLPEIINGVAYCPGTINLKPFHRLKKEDFLYDMQVNFFGAVTILQRLMPTLKKSEDASVVLFSTVAVGQGMPFHASIAAAKGAIEGLTRSLAAEWAPKIRVNAIAPSVTDTPLASRILANEDKKEVAANRHPLKKVGTALEIAQLAKFLLSEDAGWITGQVIGQDGGLSTTKVM